MNKPIFDKALNGEKTDIGNVLDDTIMAGAAVAASDEERVVVQDGHDENVVQVLDAAAEGLSENSSPDESRSLEAYLYAETNTYAATDAAFRDPPFSVMDRLTDDYLKDSSQEAQHTKGVSDQAPVAALFSTEASEAHGPEIHRTPEVATLTGAQLPPPSGSTAAKEVASATATMAANGEVSPMALPLYSVVLSNEPFDPDFLDLTHTNAPSGYSGYYVQAQAGADHVIASVAGDVVDGGSGNDTLVGYGGKDTIIGGADFDLVDYGEEYRLGGGLGSGVLINISVRDQNLGPQGITIKAGTGLDAYRNIDFYDGIEGFIGTDFSDYITAVESTASNVELRGGKGGDYLVGSDATIGDIIDGGADQDILSGGNGDDHLYASKGSLSDSALDRLDGGDGNDTLDGSSEDYLNGGAGNNTMVGGHVTYDDTSSVVINLSGSSGQGTASHRGWLDNLSGAYWFQTASGNDQIVASTWSIYANTGDGNDTLVGGAGSDTLLGGNGGDQFYGSGGNDLIDGQGDAGQIDYRSLNGAVQVTLLPDANGAGKTQKPGGAQIRSTISGTWSDRTRTIRSLEMIAHPRTLWAATFYPGGSAMTPSTAWEAQTSLTAIPATTALKAAMVTMSLTEDSATTLSLAA